MRTAPVCLGMSESQRGHRQHASADVAPELFVAEAGADDE